MSEKRTIRIRSHDIIGAIKKRAESHPTFKPIWWTTFTFRFGTTIEEAVNEWNRYNIKVVRQAKTHTIPIAGIGYDHKGRVHIHATFLADGKLTYRQLHKNWRSGISEQKLYGPGGDCIPYTLNHHDFIKVRKPFCPRPSKCRGKKGCVHIRKGKWNPACE